MKDPQPAIRSCLVVGTGLIGTSVALALRAAGVEVHLTDVSRRDEARRRLVFADLALEVITGKGPEGYRLALAALARHLSGR